MSYSNCPLKMKLIIGGKIKSLKVLKSLLKKGATMVPFVYEDKP